MAACAIAAAGCHSPAPVPAEAVAGSPAAREAQMNRLWQRRRFSELRAVLGTPLTFLDIPGGGNPPGFVAVYPRDPATGCLDAFALVYAPDPVIRLYQCR